MKKRRLSERYASRLEMLLRQEYGPGGPAILGTETIEN